MNHYVVLFCETIITIVFSFLFGMVLIKYYFNNKNGNNNYNNGINHNNGNGNYQSNTPYYEQIPYDRPVSEREPSNYPTFNKSEARHSFSDEPQSSNYTETDHGHKSEPSVYPTFNQKESRHSVKKEQSPHAPPESATSPPDYQNEPNHTYKREASNYPNFNKNEARYSFSDAQKPSNSPESGYIHKRESSDYPSFNQNESRHSFSGAPQSQYYPESQCNGANSNGEPPCVEEYDESSAILCSNSTNSVLIDYGGYVYKMKHKTFANN
ncbi:hypothetical protein DICPUDRAFT_157976 [Dictyostelium purpureum]|uniref:Uncharacterized protein n=1 Tax=Dictyostelium purpureum TaxID=5786 RepID=F1A0I0_DICPU|nr:uncharacterized protein DICPUDRAFT_157976 [Dictyostelium purpureum]EGC30298.1 hypothetical protein DICPUDRAFT_157976 [Dictyostelium purpureum]|eukprot:XP_003293177.1 hypothetical protein DICPUDRAFT_157976 [Dictyostelium purpureum]